MQVRKYESCCQGGKATHGTVLDLLARFLPNDHVDLLATMLARSSGLLSKNSEGKQFVFQRIGYRSYGTGQRLNGEFDLNGVLFWIATKGTLDPTVWENPHYTGDVSVAWSSVSDEESDVQNFVCSPEYRSTTFAL